MCVIQEPLRVLVGSYQFKNVFNRGQYKNIIRRVLNPSFNPSINYQNDIALLKIRPPITYTPGDQYGRGAIIPVCLPTQGQQFTGVTSARVSGYGLTRENGKPSPMLNTVKVQLLAASSCSRYTGMKKFNPNTQICAGYPNGGRDSCQGDSGGPLGIVWNDRVTQIGVVSFGEGCGRRGYPGIYTRVAAFRKWIDSILDAS
ncbi:Serine proteinase stubble-like protein [Leptotrombidium deliense]|uniref:Vitamin K-dependent protein C n=1 Tax=Leptotrombidium deliense TaxID=299467 RepID=A0A443STW8_9ACAR|nr:Serine proteinase stubble-like protein [Leptotrombidium deliense]